MADGARVSNAEVMGHIVNDHERLFEDRIRRGVMNAILGFMKDILKMKPQWVVFVHTMLAVNRE